MRYFMKCKLFYAYILFLGYIVVVCDIWIIWAASTSTNRSTMRLTGSFLKVCINNNMLNLALLFHHILIVSLCTRPGNHEKSGHWVALHDRLPGTHLTHSRALSIILVSHYKCLLCSVPPPPFVVCLVTLRAEHICHKFWRIWRAILTCPTTLSSWPIWIWGTSGSINN